MGRQLQHDTVATGGPCKRCGLSYSQKTAYVPCFEEGDTWESWKARQPEELQPLLKPLAEVFKPKDVVIYETPPTVEESAKGYVAGGRHELGGLLDPDDRDD